MSNGFTKFHTSTSHGFTSTSNAVVFDTDGLPYGRTDVFDQCGVRSGSPQLALLDESDEGLGLAAD